MQSRASAKGSNKCKDAPLLGCLRNAKPRLPLGRLGNAKPRLRLDTLEIQGRASAWAPQNSSLPHDFLVIAKSCQAPESHPGTLVTGPGVPKPQGAFYACVLVAPRQLNNFRKFYPVNFCSVVFLIVLFSFVWSCFHYPINNGVFNEENYGIEYGTMTTIYSYFGDKMTLDGRDFNLCRARAGVMNIMHIPIGAMRVVALMVPQLKGKLNGITFLVPIPNELILDFVVRTAKKTYKDTMKAAFKSLFRDP